MKTFKKIILDDLKANGLAHVIPKIKSVRYSTFAGGDSVSVRATDLFGPDRDKVEALLREYQYGTFNGSIDMYEYDKEKSTKERTAKFVSLQVDTSPELEAHIIAILKHQWDIVDDATAQERMSCWYDTAKHRIANKLGTEYPLV